MRPRMFCFAFALFLAAVVAGVSVCPPSTSATSKLTSSSIPRTPSAQSPSSDLIFVKHSPPKTIAFMALQQHPMPVKPSSAEAAAAQSIAVQSLAAQQAATQAAAAAQAAATAQVEATAQAEEVGQTTPTPLSPPASATSSASASSTPVATGSGADGFSATWWRCVITPESGGDFQDTSGGFGILVSTWQSYGMSGVPGDYSPAVQFQVAEEIYNANGGFGPGAWNNGAGCGKDG